MIDWVKRVEITLSTNDYSMLTDNGTISHEQAKEKAETEYDKYKVIQDKKYISDFDKLTKEATLITDKKIVNNE